MGKYDDPDRAYAEFHNVVNMSVDELDDWLDRPESKRAGWEKDDDGETIGHESGRKIKAILQKDRQDLSEDDFAHMRKVIGYVHRHKVQPPSGDIETSTWRYSLMNWGHDPCKTGN